MRVTQVEAARRDAAWMGAVYERFGLTVGLVQRMSLADRPVAA